jgi:hypothetical protein
MGEVCVGVTVGVGLIVSVTVGRPGVDVGVGVPGLQAESINAASKTSVCGRSAQLAI